MEDPLTEIATAIDLCAGAKDADAQIDAITHYFTEDAEFLHPICYVPSRPNSRERIIGIFLFYRIAVPETNFEIESVAFDEKNGKLYVDLYQMPWTRGVSWVTGGWRFKMPMHIHFWLRKKEGRWFIWKQEDTAQPLSLMLMIPPLAPIGKLIYWICQMLGLLNAVLWTRLGIWQPKKYAKRLLGAL